MNSNKYVDTAAIVQVISAVYQNPNLLDNEQYHFLEEDFTEDFHRIIFGSILNLHNLGAKAITINTIEDYLRERTSAFSIYTVNKGAEYLNKLLEIGQLSAFDYYYHRMKKFTLLRMYNKYSAMDLSWLYDPDNILDVKKKQAQEDWLDKTSEQEIVDIINQKIDSIKNKYLDNANNKFNHAGDGLRQLVQHLQTYPEVGYPLYGDFINTIYRGARLKKFYLRSASTGVGKALPNSTIIPTPEGYKAVGEIQVGDTLFDAFGKPTLVQGVYPQGKKRVWEVVFKDGRRAKCCDEHLWSYCTEEQRKEQKINRKFYTKTLKEINNMGLYQKGHGYKIQVPMQKAVEYTTKQYYIPPYTFGLLLGDGSFRYTSSNKALNFSSENDELPKAIAEEMNWVYKKNSSFNYNWTFEDPNNDKHKNVWVEEVLKDYSQLIQAKSETKFIPKEYLQGNIIQRLDLLNGLLDTDGSVDKEKGRISYWTESAQLRDNVLELCFSLGFKATWLVDTHKKNNLPLYKIDITGTPEDKIKLFKLKRKHDLILAWYNNGKRKENNLFNPIVEINELNYEEEMTCFYVDNNEHLFLMNDYIVTHNTRSMIADACVIGCSEYFNKKTNQWQSCGDPESTTIIGTEQEIDEIQTMILAFVANVNEAHILYNEYSDGEYERIQKAIEIIEQSKIYFKVMMDFSMVDIENAIKFAVREFQSRYVFFDYIHSSMKILGEISSKAGVKGLREDNVLFMISVKLKDLCNQYGIFLMSATQLSNDYHTAVIYDQGLLQGAKAIAN